MKYLYLFICALFILSFPLSAQEETPTVDEAESLDDLFEAPPEDIIVEEPQTDHREQFEKEKTVNVIGSFEATGLVAAGWAGWNFIPDLSQDFDGSTGLTSTAKVTFDARPAPEFRVYGSLSTAFNPLEKDDDWDDFIASLDSLVGSASWSSPYFNELYCDYILKDFLFVRLGKHAISWGQGRLFTPGNLMSDSTASFNVRVSMPTLAGLTFVILTNGGVSYRQLVYAGKVDFVLFNTLISPAVRYNFDEGVESLLSLKKVILKTDFLIDAVAHYDEGFQSVTALGGFFREWTDFKLYGEYRFHWNSDGSMTHDAGLAAGYNNPFGAPFDVGSQIIHNFLDNSGTITLGISQSLWPYVTMKVGMPIVYGTDNSSAVLNNTDPEKRRIALILSLTLSGSF